MPSKQAGCIASVVKTDDKTRRIKGLAEDVGKVERGFFDVLIRFVCDSQQMFTISYVEAGCSSGYLNRRQTREIRGLAKAVGRTAGCDFFCSARACLSITLGLLTL